MGTGSFPEVKNGRGVTLTPHPLLVPWSWKGTAIPLFPLWAVRSVQSLSACTRVLFTFTLLLLGHNPVQHVTVLNTVGNCNRMISNTILYYNIMIYYNLMGPLSYTRSVVDRNVVIQRMTIQWLYQMQANVLKLFDMVMRPTGAYTHWRISYNRVNQ